MNIRFRLFEYRYLLSFKWNYCGAIASTVNPDRQGKIKGNDLDDGKLWRLPWVLWDIFCYEFVLGRWRNQTNLEFRRVKKQYEWEQKQIAKKLKWLENLK